MKDQVLTLYKNFKAAFLSIKNPTSHQQQLLELADSLIYQIALEIKKQGQNYDKKLFSKILEQTETIIKSPDEKTLREYKELIDKTPYGQQDAFKTKAGADIRTVGAIAGVILFLFACVLMSPIVTPVLAIVALAVMLYSGLIGDFVEHLGQGTGVKKAMNDFYDCAKSPSSESNINNSTIFASTINSDQLGNKIDLYNVSST